MSELPDGWQLSSLGEVAEFVMGQAPNSKDCNIDGVGTVFVKAGEFGKRTPIVREWTTRPLKMALQGDVLVCVVGATAGKINLAIDCAIGRSVAAIRPEEFIETDLLHYFLKGKVAFLRGGSTGSAQGVISKDDLANLEIPLPPAAEQKRIAKKLDALLAQVDTLKARIDAIPALLKRLRSSVLSAATTGQLSGGVQAHWQTFVLQDLVEHSMVGVVRSASEQSEEVKGRHPYLKMNNINQEWGFNTEKLVGVLATEEEVRRYELKKGDWLFNTRNSVELVGKSCVWKGAEGFLFNNNILRLRFTDLALPEYIEIYLRSSRGKASLARIKSATTSVAAIYQKALMQQEIPLPGIDEQTEIVRRVEQLFAFADQLEAKVATAKQRIDTLTQSILAKAFRGELVPQDPSDEPASVLLERIRAQRASAPKPKRGRKTSA